MKEHFRVPSFARRIGRALRFEQKNLMTDVLPKVEISEEENFEQLAKGFKSAILEIGFGNGEHLAHFAQNNPEVLCIGAEPYINGVVVLLKAISEYEIENVKVYKDDVRKLLTRIPEKFFENIFIICPDPWPKQRQKKRRLINSEFIKSLLPKTKRVVIATDHLDYAKWILKHATDAGVAMRSDNIADYTQLPEGWIYTKYQRRGIKHGSNIYYFVLTP